MSANGKRASKKQADEDIKLVLEIINDNPTLAAQIVRERPWVAKVPLPRHDNASGFDGGNLAALAAARRDVTLLRAALDAGSAVNDMGVRDSATPIMHAMSDCFESNRPLEPIVELLIERGARLDMVNAQGCGVLYQASSNINQSLFESLIERGASVNCYDQNGRHQIVDLIETISGSEERRQRVLALIEAGADVSVGTPSKPSRSALWQALGDAEYEIADAICRKGASLTGRTHLGETIAHLLDEPGPMTWLLSREPQLLEARDSMGRTPLAAVSTRLLSSNSEEKRAGQLGVVLKLLELGADIDSQDYRGQSKLHTPRELLAAVKVPSVVNALRALNAQMAAREVLREIDMAP